MRKLLFVTLGILMLASCNKDVALETPDDNLTSGNTFSGVMNSPQTKGVAQKEKLWAIGTPITIKFLDGTAAMQQAVKKYAAEWLEYANVKFYYMDEHAGEENNDANVRISFYNDESRYVTWAYTGNDCKTVTDQSLPTASFDSFEYITEAEKKAQVLRIFGQILGLELEHRHLDFDPKWRNNLELYWTGEIEDIPWNTLKKYVFDPLNEIQVVQTENFDESSIMIWAFPSRYTTETSIKFSNTELSEMDKEFIGTLYPLSKEELMEPTILTFMPIGDEFQLDLAAILNTTKNVKVYFDDTDVYEGPANEIEIRKYPRTVKIYGEEYALNIDKNNLVTGCHFGGANFTFIKFGKYNSINRIQSISFTRPPLFTQEIFDGTFEYCVQLTSIPDSLFANSPNAKEFINTFLYSNINSIPENLFANCNTVNNISSIFYWTKVTSVPENLFKDCINVKNFKMLFCYSPVASIPENLFKYNTKVESFRHALARIPIKTVPAGIFQNSLKAKDFFGIFESCRELVSVPGNTFNNLEITKLGTAFKRCVSLQTAPKLWEMFDFETTVPTTINCYSECGLYQYLDEVPVGWR